MAWTSGFFHGATAILVNIPRDAAIERNAFFCQARTARPGEDPVMDLPYAEDFSRGRRAI